MDRIGYNRAINRTVKKSFCNLDYSGAFAKKLKKNLLSNFRAFVFLAMALFLLVTSSKISITCLFAEIKIITYIGIPVCFLKALGTNLYKYS